MRPDGVESLVARVPAWRDRDLAIRPIGAGPNPRHHVVTVDGDEWVVRCPDLSDDLPGTDRAGEVEAAVRSAALGIGPQVLGELPHAHTPITRHVPGSALEPSAAADRLADVAALVRRFGAGAPLRNTFHVHRVVEWCARSAAAQGVVPPSAYERLHQQSRRIEQAVAASALPLVPSHNDLVTANLLVPAAPSPEQADGLLLVGFASAGMNDPCFDLACFSVDAALPPAADDLLLHHAFGSVSPSQRARLELMKVMVRFRDGMRAVVRHAISGAAEDAEAAADHLERCEREVAQPRFTSWLEDAARPDG